VLEVHIPIAAGDVGEEERAVGGDGLGEVGGVAGHEHVVTEPDFDAVLFGQ
jgi:hypothetical protein